MKWSPEAESAIRKVPFFVRKRVRARVEEQARNQGKTSVTIQDVDTTKQRYLNAMASEVKGYQVESCFGSGGCPNRSISSDALVRKIETVLQQADLLEFLKTKVGGDLKFHHELRVSVADCPNACSQPQIRDIGIIGAAEPTLTDEPCTHCAACEEACREAAIQLSDEVEKPVILMQRCVRCGQCMAVCPTGTLAAGMIGYRVQLGGKLGRHPRLARELPCILSEDDVIGVVRDCIDLFKLRNTAGERFGNLLTDADKKTLRDRYCRYSPSE